jgi:ABC-type transport system involved in cytochrome c biogenesis ATPase subunit
MSSRVPLEWTLSRVETERKAMTPAEAKMLILAEWRTWIGHQQATASHTTAEALDFFNEIEHNKPELLSFESVDKWHLVRGWLLEAQLIKE